MAMKPLRPCRHPGCSALVRDGYCDAHRPKRTNDRSQEAQSWRWMYRTGKWLDELRPEQLLREPFCRACALRGVRAYATDVDHVIPHRGVWALFVDPNNLQSLCHSCHSRKTAAEMAAEKRGRF